MSDFKRNSGGFRLNPFTRAAPQYDIREIGAVSRFQLRTSGRVTTPQVTEHLAGILQAIPLPGQTMRPGPSQTEFPLSDGPNYFVIKLIELWVGLPGYFSHEQWPANTIAHGLGVFFGLSPRDRAAVQLPDYYLILKNYPAPVPSTEIGAASQNLDQRIPNYGWENVTVVYNKNGALNQVNALGESGPAPFLVADPFNLGNPASGVLVSDEWQKNCNYVLSPQDWLNIVISGGRLASKSGQAIATPLNTLTVNLRIQGYFSPSYADLIPYINA